MQSLTLDGNTLTIPDLQRISLQQAKIRISGQAQKRMDRSRRLVESWVDRGETVYGVTTGFGEFANVPISRDNLEQLQENLIFSHAVGAGAPLPPEVARDFAARFGRRLHSFYGSSETGGIAYDATGVATLNGSVGRRLRGVKLTGLSGARLRVSSAAVLTHGNRRHVGELGAWLMPDRVTLTARGDVTLLGRRGTTVKIAGRRVNLAEVSARLRRLPDVREAWAGVSAGNDPVLGAVVATGRTAVELRAMLHADTAAWKIPKKLIVVAALPVTARGKTDTRALHAMTF
jgi:acyl-coenzyme A synthetase/AMP-(fatty) acid ligase